MAHDSHAHTHEVTSQIVDDLLAAAFEGGINYWCPKVVVVNDNFCGAEFASEVLSRGGRLMIHVEDEDPQELTLVAFEAGVRKAAEHYGLTVERFYEDHDAEYADVAVQYALFNEIVYG